MKKNEKKTRGKVYTPANIVKHILDFSGYCGNKILKKHVIDNSCGDGAFLVEVVERYIQQALKKNLNPAKIKKELETYIHGIEINQPEYENGLKNLSAIAEKYGITEVKWDVICENTLNITKYDGKMDFVVGNPPYVRVQNLGESFKNVKTFSFAKSGMTDLFIVFYEIGLRMLNENGVLGYITPSSVFNSLAGRDMRRYITDKKLLTKVVDLKHNLVFDAATYTAILILSKNNSRTEVEYSEYNMEKDSLIFVDNLSYEDFYFNKNFYFADKKSLNHLKAVLNTKKKSGIAEVKNGFATLMDKFFIGNFDFKEYVIDIVKASTGEKKKCLFPYKNGCLIPYNELTKTPIIKKYFEKNKKDLNKRSLENKSEWYAFGRSQGIGDVEKSKFAINYLIKDKKSIKLINCPKGVGVYSGLYILTEVPEEKIRDIIVSEEFITYIKLLGKYKNGGYYTFSSDDLSKYLQYELSL